MTRSARAACAILAIMTSLHLPAPAQSPTTHPAIVSSQFTYESAPYPQCHASSIVEAAPGRLVAAWFGGTRERNPDVAIWVAHFQSGKWQEAVEVANGVQRDGTRLPTWNPVLFQP